MHLFYTSLRGALKNVFTKMPIIEPQPISSNVLFLIDFYLAVGVILFFVSDTSSRINRYAVSRGS
jgi:hypothetical protein